ncbi:MAG: cell division protein FtsW [Actinobacteria bacterium HGW-Actinobacteria-4]|nr:MAG: cell division protein FtsW [Actinobacteria bacterium HGW-Actinobacteria-4]
MTTTAARPASTDSAWRSPAASYYLLVAASATLVLVGLAVVLSSSSIYSIGRADGNAYALFMVQVGALLLGLVALGVGSRMTITMWRRSAPWVLFISVILLIVVATVGIESGGNTAWIRVGLVTMQPAEIAKLGLALYLGVVLSNFRHELTSFKRIMVPGGIVTAGIIALVMVGRDMGTAVVVLLVAAAAYWVAGLPIRFFSIGVIVSGIAIAIMMREQESRMRRLLVWLAEDCDRQLECYQSTHGTWALASGGLWGLGPGMSREKWGYLPAADNDFIYAIVGEEFGLIGTLLVLIAFAMIVIAVNRIVHRHRDPFVQITAAAIGAWIVGQAAINIAVVVGLAPVTGVPLPLVSSGGSSLVMSLAAIGVLMAFARREPGAAEAFAARPSVIKRSLAVMSRSRRG